jgi:hypothetical protein
MQLGNSVWEIRLNTYVDSIELSKVIRTALNFPAANSNGSGRSRNSLQCTRTLSNQMNVGCPVGAGLQFFADVRPGRMLQKFPGYVFGRLKAAPKAFGAVASQGWPSAAGPNQIGGFPTDPTQTLDAQASRDWSATHLGLAMTDPVRPSRLAAAGAKINFGSRPPPAARDQTPCAGAAYDTPPGPA